MVMLTAMSFFVMSQPAMAAQASIEQVEQQISGKWVGHFINRQNTRYPITYTLTGKGGKISGEAYIPDSTYDVHPTIAGTYRAKGKGNQVNVKLSSGFTGRLKVVVAKDGTFWLMGSISGNNSGRLQLQKQ